MCREWPPQKQGKAHEEKAWEERRTALKLLLGSSLALGTVSLSAPQRAQAAALTREQRDQLTPDQVVEMLQAGNERFRTGKMQAHNYLAQKRASAGGQYPAAAILSCIDSRAPAGAKVVLVMGHTACGAVKGAIDNVELGHLTGLLDRIKPAIPATTYAGERTSKNDAFVDAVAATNARRTVEEIRTRSSVLAGLEKDGRIRMVASMYHLVGGRVELLA